MPFADDWLYIDPAFPSLCTDTTSTFGTARRTKLGFRTALNSRCILTASDLERDGFTSTDRMACYPMRCSAAGDLYVTVLGTELACPFGGSVDLGAEGVLDAGTLTCARARALVC
jgi:hypothetical protein